VVLGYRLRDLSFHVRGCHSLWRSFPTPSISSHRSILAAPQPRRGEPRRFGLIPVRSPLLRESRLISSPRGTEMFHFPRFASQVLYIQTRDDGTLLPPGFPIRKPPDHSLLGGSPKLIAAFHVLHRLLAPRHPPVALDIFPTQNYRLFNCQRTIARPTPILPPSLVEAIGFEPTTTCVQGRRSPI
jgi:hypothetical protein